MATAPGTRLAPSTSVAGNLMPRGHPLIADWRTPAHRPGSTRPVLNRSPDNSWEEFT